MSVSRTAPWCAACLLWCAVAATASQASSIPLPTVAPAAPAPLRTAVQAVWAGSPEVQAAAAELEGAHARARAAAQPLYNPELTAEAENADVDRRALGISLPLDLSGKRRARAVSGAAALHASEVELELRRIEVAARWLQAWVGSELASRAVELGAERVALMVRFVELAARRLAVGDISSPERDLAALALGDARVRQATLVAAEAAARGALQAIVVAGSVEAPEFPAGLPPAPSVVTPRDAAELAEVRRAIARADGARADADVAARARIPDPVLRLAGGEVRAGNVRDPLVAISISVPLPVLDSGRAAVDAARADADAMAATVHAQRLQSQARLVEARTRYDALREAGVALRSGRAAAFDERTRLLEKLWRAGEINTSDYLVQVRESLDAALSAIDLENQLWQAWFDYLTAAGRLVDWIDGRTEEKLR